MIVKKQCFEIDELELESGVKIPVKVGYETYGTLNEKKNNAILVSHYFSATSHAAGKYREDDSTVGWWDTLIGEKKALDTEKYFIICIDNLCNVQVKNPNVITTGPASLDPKTNQPYGMRFPIVSFKDVAYVQKLLVESMGIQVLEAVIGPSAGGMISFQWAVHYPQMVKRCIGVITNVQNPVITSFSVLQHAIRAIKLDKNFNDGNYYNAEEPIEGIRLAAQMMYVGAFTPEFLENMYSRDSKDDKGFREVNEFSSYEEALYKNSIASTKLVDANSWLYTCKATMNHDIAKGFDSLESALKRITAKVLMIPCKQDMLQPYNFNKVTVEKINNLGGYAEIYPIESEKGHMAGVLDTHLFEDKIKEFLSK